MYKHQQEINDICILGEGTLPAGITLCLLNGGHSVTAFPEDASDFLRQLKFLSGTGYIRDVDLLNTTKLKIDPVPEKEAVFHIVIAITPEDLTRKRDMLRGINSKFSNRAIIAINTESFDLDLLQAEVDEPHRLIGLNWAEPAHTTFFLEIISNDRSSTAAEVLRNVAMSRWGKDPYMVSNSGIRSRLFSAMVREAAFLIENGYADMEDIDRACRNDAGYYLPFCGNCRYMDLMGTNAYGIVMKDLNPELSKNTVVPRFIRRKQTDGDMGMATLSGFYQYAPLEVVEWKQKMKLFSHQVHDLMVKYSPEISALNTGATS